MNRNINFSYVSFQGVGYLRMDDCNVDGSNIADTLYFPPTAALRMDCSDADGVIVLYGEKDKEIKRVSLQDGDIVSFNGTPLGITPTDIIESLLPLLPKGKLPPAAPSYPAGAEGVYFEGSENAYTLGEPVDNNTTQFQQDREINLAGHILRFKMQDAAQSTAEFWSNYLKVEDQPGGIHHNGHYGAGFVELTTTASSGNVNAKIPYMKFNTEAGSCKIGHNPNGTFEFLFLNAAFGQSKTNIGQGGTVFSDTFQCTRPGFTTPASPFRIGFCLPAAVTLDTGHYIEIQIGSSIYKLALVN